MKVTGCRMKEGEAADDADFTDGDAGGVGTDE
jgi:hypothetical protein